MSSRMQQTGQSAGRKDTKPAAKDKTTASQGRFRRWLSPQGDSSVFSRRTQVLAWALAVIILFCAGRLFQMQILSSGPIAQAATNSRTVTETLPALRGSIVDAKGRVFAQSVERYTVFADQNAVALFVPHPCSGQDESNCQQLKGKPLTTKGAAAVASLLAPVLGMDPLELGPKLVGHNGYVVLKKKVVPEVKRNIDKLNLQGVIGTVLTTSREYPDGALLGSVVGSLNAEGKGVAGVERMEDAKLRGTDGKVTYQQGAGGQEIPGTRTTSMAPVNGQRIQLSVDQDVQWYVEKALDEGKTKHSAAWGIAIVQRVSDGRLIAVADTDGYKAGSAQAALKGSRAMTTTFEPGSTGKLITTAALLQDKLRAADSQFQVPYSASFNGQLFHDSHQHGVERLTLAGIIQQSSNVGTIMAAQGLSKQERYDWITRFGIGKLSGIGFPGESRGLLAKPDAWDDRTAQTVLFGQGYAATALQMTNVVATIANKGIELPQSLIESTTDGSGKTAAVPVPDGTRVVDASVCSSLLNMMESVTDSYASSGVQVPGYRIAGKSGTAQVAGDNGQLTNVIGDWIGAIPADNPQYVVMVAYMNPTPIYGGESAGPVMAQIGGFLMQKYGVLPSQPRKDAIPTTW